jgi:hypothetical protein
VRTEDPCEEGQEPLLLDRLRRGPYGAARTQGLHLRFHVVIQPRTAAVTGPLFAQERALREKSGLAPLQSEEHSAANVRLLICILPLDLSMSYYSRM